MAANNRISYQVLWIVVVAELYLWLSKSTRGDELTVTS